MKEKFTKHNAEQDANSSFCKYYHSSWNLKKSFYRKLCLFSDWVINQLKEKDFIMKHSSSNKGFFTIIATKSIS